jgi:peroxiredoxin
MFRLPVLSNRLRGLLSILVLLAGAAWTGWSAAKPGALTAGKIPAPQTGFLAPDFSLPAVDGQTISLSSLRGSPVIINFWASWCRPCRQEMPALQQVYEVYQAQGLVVVGVNVTSQDSRPAAQAFVEEMGLNFPILFDEAGQAASLYQMQAFPTTFFVDDQGLIREVVLGGPMAEALLRIRAEQLLGGNNAQLPRIGPGAHGASPGRAWLVGLQNLWGVR